MATIDNKYDSIGEFHQRVAIVKKNGKYGAIMFGDMYYTVLNDLPI